MTEKAALSHGPAGRTSCVTETYRGPLKVFHM